MLNQTMAIMPITAAGAPGAVPGPATNLNIGMDYWGAPPSAALPAMRGKIPTTPVSAGIVSAGSRDSVQSQIRLQVIFVPVFQIQFSFLLIMFFLLLLVSLFCIKI